MREQSLSGPASRMDGHRVNGDAVTAAAARIRTAFETRTPCAPLRDLIGAEDVNAAYAVQEISTAARLADGATIVGRKIGLTSLAVQAQLGVDQPDFGMLFSDMAFADGDVLDHTAVLQPRVEAEIAFVLANDLAEGTLDLGQVRAAVGYATAALEICGSRIQDWNISFADTVADNASSGAFVLGTERRSLEEFEPINATMLMTVTGQDDSAGNGAACLGDPLLALQWLAIKAREFGSPLRAGQVILSGALGPMRPIAAGASATAHITGLGSVSVHFAGQES